MNYRSQFNDFDTFYKATLENVHKDWITSAFENEYENSLRAIWNTAQFAKKSFVPAPENILRACRLAPKDVKVILVAQDPYPRMEHAVGLAFHANGKPTRSLQRIKRNLQLFGHDDANDKWSIESWADQGVLLLNISLTTEEGKSNAHKHFWQGTVEKLLVAIPKNSVAILLGRNAQQIRNVFPSKYVVEHVHPVSRGKEFYTVDVFGKANELLEQLNKEPIIWKLV